MVFILFCALISCALAIVTVIRVAPLMQLLPVRLLSAFSISLFLGSLGTIFSLTAPTFDEKVFWFYLRVLGTLFIAPLWLLFLTSAFERWRWLLQPKIAIILFAPCIANFLVVLHPATRHLVFREMEPFIYGKISFLRFQYGSLYGSFYAWSLALMLLSFALSAVAYWHEHGFRRRQVLILNAGFGAAILFAFLPAMENDTEELRWLVSSCFSFLVTQMGILYAVFRQRLLSIEPLAAARNFQKFPDPVLVIDDRENIMGASNRAITFFNLPKDFLGQKLKALLPNLGLAPGEQVLIDSQQKSHSFHLTIENLGDQNNPPGSLVFFRDINTQKLTERKLQDGIEFRAHLLAFLAHDLTGLLENQAILSLALQSKVSAEHHPEMTLLTSSAQTSQELVGNIMAWIQSQAIQFQPIVRPFEWNLLLKEALEQMESRLKVRGIKVNFQSETKQLFGQGDSEMLAAVFRNFVSNAIRATPHGKSIHVLLKADQYRVLVSVRDEGPGIDPAKLESIVTASKELLLHGIPDAEGSGIGLMIARQFIALHDGTFEMKSNLGFGTEASFSIPL